MKKIFGIFAIAMALFATSCTKECEEPTVAVVASFTVPEDPTTDGVTFTNTSTGADTYLWDFGDESTSTEKNPTHPYDEPGYYTIKLTASKGNVSATTTVSTYVYSPESPL
ncbi:MAG: hypothetical protein RL222_1359 [Bacteroidota bacterium]|jgi:PKD repeat protein